MKKRVKTLLHVVFILFINSVLATEQCYQYITTQVEGVNNEWTLCLKGTRATNKIYYPNSGWNSAKCAQNGFVKKLEKAIEIKLDKGDCNNRRVQGGFTLICKETDSKALTCKDVKFGYVLEFVEINR